MTWEAGICTLIHVGRLINSTQAAQNEKPSHATLHTVTTHNMRLSVAALNEYSCTAPLNTVVEMIAL